MKPLWIIQENLNDDDKALLPIFAELGIPYKLISIIPFSDIVPDVDYSGPIIVRGSTTTLRGAEKKAWRPGVWHNENFKPTVYAKHYDYLNSNFVSCTLEAATSVWSMWPEVETLFVRPNSDYKEFTGGLMTEREVEKLARGAALKQYPFDSSLDLFVAPYKDIVNESRFIIVNGVVISGSFYRLNKRLAKNLRDSTYKSILIDSDRKEFRFAQEQASKWGPDEVYCLDVAETSNGEMGVLECNCFNASGLYGEAEKIVEEVSKFVERKYNEVSVS